MMNKFKKQMKNEKGLTLIELLAVIVILAIVAAIAIPAIGNIINTSRDRAIIADASNVLAGAKLAVLDNSCAAVVTGKGAGACTQTELEDFVEGMKSGSTFTASKAADGVWTVNYSKLTELKTKNFVAYNSGTITDVKITEALNK